MVQAPFDDPIARRESESRSFGMLAHLCYYANFWMPFGGLVGTILIYSLRKYDDAVARENQRNALNFEITLGIMYAILFVLYIGFFFSLFFYVGVAAPIHGTHAKTAQPPIGFLIGIFSIFAIAALLGITGIVTAGLAARAAWLGRVFRYPFAIGFVRETSPVAPEPL